MGEAEDAWEAFLTALNRDLEGIEKQTFEESKWGSFAYAREKMLGVMRASGSGRYARGLAVRDYRNLYRQSGGKQAWRDKDGAGAKIARIEDNSDAKSADHWIEDAEFAEPLGDHLRFAMLARNCDPTVRKNRDIVALLKQNKPENQANALKLVDDAIMARSKVKRKGPPNTIKLEQQLIVRIANFIKKNRSPHWKEALDKIYKEVVAVLKAERAKRAAAISKDGNHLIRAAGPGARRPSGPMAVPKPASPRITVTGSTRRAPKTPTAPSRYRKHLHPWGDTCLNTLRLLNPGPGGRRSGEYHRRLLYDVRDNPKATRYLLLGMLDLFDPGIPDRIFDEHLHVFQQVPRHTFLALTPYVSSVQRHWKRLNRAFPDNFRPGVRIDCVDHLKRLRILSGMNTRTKWASFVNYRSDALRPLAKSTFLDDIKGLELIVFGWDFANPESPLSCEDAISLAEAATHSGTTFFFTHPDSKQAFLTGNSPMCELAVATNAHVNDPSLTAAFERAQSCQLSPDGWFGHADWATTPHCEGFDGEEVELFDYRSETEDGPIPVEEAS